MQVFIGPGADSSQPTPPGFIVNHQTHLLSDTKHRASKGHPNSHGHISPAERSLRSTLNSHFQILPIEV